MHPASSLTPKPDHALLIDDQISNEKIAEFLKKNKSGNTLCLFTTLNKQLYLATDTIENRQVFLYSSRKLVKSTLKNLKSDIPEAKFLSDIRASLERDATDSQVMRIGHDQLESIIANHTPSVTSRTDEKKGATSRKQHDSELDSVRPHIKSMLKKQVEEQNESGLKSLGAKWAAATLDRFREGKSKPSKEELQQFKLLQQARPDAELIDEFTRYCNNQLTHTLANGELKQIAESVVNAYKQEMSTGEFDADKNSITVGKQVMRPIGNRHQGGFGAVQVYADSQYPDRTLAAKFATPAKNRLIIEDARMELHNHLLAMGKGHENVVSIRGAIRTDKELILLMEDCSGGTLDSVGQKLAAAEKSGAIDATTAGQVRLTLARDFLRGLTHLHGETDVTHGDFKLTNIFIGVDGFAKVGDFDRTEAGDSYRMSKSKLPAANQYLAPEVIFESADTDAAYQKFSAQTPPPGIKEKSAFRKLQAVTLSKDADSFAAGVALYELFYGVNPLVRHLQNIQGFVAFSDYHELMEKFSACNPQGRMHFLFDGAPLLPGLTPHEEVIRKMIFSLMAPDPEYRAGPAATLKRPIFSLPELDKPEIRDVIRTL